MLHNPSPALLPREIAQQILDRAATIDTAEDRLDLATLRAAALDAGISPESFERALTEAVASSHGRARHAAVVAANAYEIAIKAAGVGVLSGTLVIGAVSLFAGSPPDEAVLGALIGGGGALAGVVVYLIRKLRGG